MFQVFKGSEDLRHEGFVLGWVGDGAAQGFEEEEVVYCLGGGVEECGLGWVVGILPEQCTGVKVFIDGT